MGPEVDVATTPLLLSAGWNMIGYLPQSDMAIETALSSVTAQITLVKDNDGLIYWPDQELINMIGNMKVGQGYQIHMKTGMSLTYPAGTPKERAKAHLLISLPTVKHYLFKLHTGNNATVLAPSVTMQGQNAFRTAVRLVHSTAKENSWVRAPSCTALRPFRVG